MEILVKKALLVLSTLMIVGCGGPEAIWVHDSKDAEGFIADRNFCTQRIDPNQAGYNDRFAQCMGQFGWRQEAK